jgi:hypothetical protein
MSGLLLEDVTLNRDQQVTAQIRFNGGAHRTLSLPLPLKSWQRWVTLIWSPESGRHKVDNQPCGGSWVFRPNVTDDSGRT